MTAPRFELTSQRPKVSRLPIEPPGRPAYSCCSVNFIAMFVVRYKKIDVLFTSVILKTEKICMTYDYTDMASCFLSFAIAAVQ